MTAITVPGNAHARATEIATTVTDVIASGIGFQG